MVTEKQIQGKKNRQQGKDFELKVRHDLEKKGYIVCKWANNVEEGESKNPFEWEGGMKLISAKHTFNPFTKAMSAGNGFPDFVAFKQQACRECSKPCGYEVIGIESKMNGYLDSKEKDKVKWLLDNNVFSFILIAHKSEERGGEVLYEQQLKGGIKQQIWKHPKPL